MVVVSVGCNAGWMREWEIRLGGGEVCPILSSVLVTSL
jgi:hypothetical protein